MWFSFRQNKGRRPSKPKLILSLQLLCAAPILTPVSEANVPSAQDSNWLSLPLSKQLLGETLKLILFFVLKILFIYLFIFRERGREGEREGEKLWCEREASISCPSHMSRLGTGLRPRHVPCLGIEPATFHFAEQCPTNWTTAVRAKVILDKV